MRPKTPLAERISAHTGIPSVEIQRTIENPEPTAGRCWQWRGHAVRLVPMMKEGGKPTPVRRVLHAAVIGEPVPPEVRLAPGCATFWCVNPNHTQKKIQKPSAMCDEPDPVFDPDASTTLEDAVDAVYMAAEPWDAQQIATYRDIPLALVNEAIAAIRVGRY